MLLNSRRTTYVPKITTDVPKKSTYVSMKNSFGTFVLRDFCPFAEMAALGNACEPMHELVIELESLAEQAQSSMIFEEYSESNSIADD